MKMLPFKAFLTYRVSPVFQFNATALNEVLKLLPAGDPALGQMKRSGFVAPFPKGDRLVEDLTKGRMVFTLETAERMIPGKTLREHLDRAAAAFEKRESRVPRAKDKQMLKVEVLQRLMPQAFIVRSQVMAIYAPPYLLVGTTSVTKSETLLAAVRKVLGSFPCIPLTTDVVPLTAFTEWVSGKEDYPDNFEPGETFTAKGKLDTPRTIQGKKVDLSAESLSDFLSDDYLVTAMQLNWQDPELAVPTSFVVNETLGIKSVEWPDAILDRAQDDVGESDDDENGHALLHASAILLADRADALVCAVRDALGGEPEGVTYWLEGEKDKKALTVPDEVKEELLKAIAVEATLGLKDWKLGDAACEAAAEDAAEDENLI